jgi:hypothetical protein
MKTRFGLIAVLFASLIGLQGIGMASTHTIATFNQSSVTIKGNVGSSTTTTVHIYDKYSPPLTIGSITVSGAQASEFTTGGTCYAGAVVQETAPCTLDITFTPRAVGTRTATLTATFANADTKTLALSGQSLASAPILNILSAYSNPIDLGSKAVGTTLASLGSIPRADTWLSIADAGGSTLSIAATVIGMNAGDFQLTGFTDRSASCAPSVLINSSNLPCNLPILFLPTDVGTRTATLRITSNDPAKPVVDIALTGVGTPGAPPAPPPPIVSAADFSDVWTVANEANRSIQITHHKFSTDALVAFWHTYDVDGKDMWLELTDGKWTDSLTFTGNLHRSTGTAFSLPDNAAQDTDVVVGTATFTFTDANNGTFTYDVNGTKGSFAITRFAF